MCREGRALDIRGRPLPSLRLDPRCEAREGEGAGDPNDQTVSAVGSLGFLVDHDHPTGRQDVDFAGVEIL